LIFKFLVKVKKTTFEINISADGKLYKQWQVAWDLLFKPWWSLSGVIVARVRRKRCANGATKLLIM